MAASPWQKMDARSRRPMSELCADDIPTYAGVYALYRDGTRRRVLGE